MQVLQFLIHAFRTHSGELGWDVTKDAVKYLLATGAGWLLKTASDRWRTRRARSFWRPFLSDDLRLVIGRFGEFNDFEKSGLFGVGDAIALAELQRYLGQLGAKPQVAYADQLKGDDIKHTLILLGGPDANSMTDRAVQRIDSKSDLGTPK